MSRKLLNLVKSSVLDTESGLKQVFTAAEDHVIMDAGETDVMRIFHLRGCLCGSYTYSILYSHCYGGLFTADVVEEIGCDNIYPGMTRYVF